MFFLVSICAVFFSILLILVVFVQKPKQDGLSSQFSSMGANQLIGVTKTTDLMEQITWGLAVTILILTISSSYFLRHRTTKISPNIEKVQQEENNKDSLPEEPEETPATNDKTEQSDQSSTKQ